MATPEVWVPAPFESVLNHDEVYRAYERLAQTDLSGYQEEMYQALTPSRDLADIKHPDMANETEAILVFNSFGGPYNESSHILARAIQELAPQPMRTFHLPNNTRRNHYYSLNPVQAARDVFGQVAHTYLERVSKRNVKSVHIFGSSQGSAVGAAALGLAKVFELEVSSATLVDAPNMVDRAKKELSKDFRATGLGALNKAIQDSGIPALNEAQGVRGRKLDPLFQLPGFISFWFDSRIPENRLLQQAMGRNTFEGDLKYGVDQHDATNDLPIIHVPLFEASTISRPGIRVNGAQEYIVPPYGHEGADNVVLAGLLARLAIGNQPIPV